VPAPPAVGQRIGWSDLPADVQRGIEAVLGGRVIGAESQAGGFSPGTADRVRLATGGRAFVKAVSPDQNPDSPDLLRREADYLDALSRSPRVPRPIGRYDDGHWIALAMEEVDGRCPPVPWSDEHVDAAMATLAELAADLTPTPIAGLSPVTEGLASIFGGWERLRDQPHPALDPWVAARLDVLVEMSADALHRLTGDTVVHCDIRADNLLVRPDGSMVVVDWPWALTGPDWLDRLMLVINIDLYGGQDADGVVARHLPHVDPLLITGCLAGLCAFFTDAARQPEVPGLPTLRAFQRAQAESTAVWLRRRIEARG
jgi:aminoglycoside phosphotransferase (APT) family kinase protein